MRLTICKQAALRWAVLGTAAVAGLAGCGYSTMSWLRPGAAALYDGTRITTTRLASEVTNLNAGYLAYKAKLGSQLHYGPAGEARQVLTWMLRFATIEQLRAREGIYVTAAQAQDADNGYASLLREEGATLPEFAVEIGLPPDMLPEFGRLLVIQSRLVNRLDHGKQPAQGSAAAAALSAEVSRLQCVAAKSLAIQVNPQFGVLDYSTFSVVATPGELGSVPAAQAARLAPRC